MQGVGTPLFAGRFGIELGIRTVSSELVCNRSLSTEGITGALIQNAAWFLGNANKKANDALSVVANFYKLLQQAV